MITTNERMALLAFIVLYSLGWLFFGQDIGQQGIWQSERGKLLAAAPALFCLIWIIAAPEQTTDS